MCLSRSSLNKAVGIEHFTQKITGFMLIDRRWKQSLAVYNVRNTTIYTSYPLDEMNRQLK